MKAGNNSDVLDFNNFGETMFGLSFTDVFSVVVLLLFWFLVVAPILFKGPFVPYKTALKSGFFATFALIGIVSAIFAVLFSLNHLF